MPGTLAALLAPAASYLVAFLLLRGLLRHRIGAVALDHPNERSLHDTPVPRTGGLAVACGVAAGWTAVAWSGGDVPWPLWAGGLLLVAVSFVDDMRGLTFGWRLCAHLFAAGLFVSSDMASAVHPVLAAGVLVGMVWMTNLYNFMDGSDGLAGGMALSGFGCYGLAAWLGGDTAFAAVNLTVAAAAAAFLSFNFPPARIFLGDAGSVPLGFLAAASGVAGWQSGLWPVWFPPLVFSPFVADATVTLARRLLRGERVWQAHREHYYQRLVRMGLGHRHTALLEYVLMLLASVSAVWALHQEQMLRLAVLLFWGTAYAAVMTVIDIQWAKFVRRQVTDDSAKA